MSENQFQIDPEKLSALAHPVRLRIIGQLAKSNACCVKDLVDCSDLAQSTISQHLKKLLNANLVRYQTFQQSSWYELNREEFESLAVTLDEMFEFCRCSEANLNCEKSSHDADKKTGKTK